MDWSSSNDQEIQWSHTFRVNRVNGAVDIKIIEEPRSPHINLRLNDGVITKCLFRFW